ncbi:MAG: GldG family protein [Nevskiales bacterium]
MGLQEKTLQRLQHALSIVLVLVVAGLFAWLSTRYSTSFDWTANNRNSLTEPSKRLLDSLPDPIKVTAWVFPDKTVRSGIESKFEAYQRHKPDISVEFIDPAKQPQKARELNVGASGEVFVEYQGRRESLTALSEQTITTALQRLAYTGERWVLFLEGHGERKLEGADGADYGDFAKLLRDKGLKVRGLNLAQAPTIPHNTAVLIIAGPQRNLLPGEVKLIRDYVAGGGNLLWLADPDPESRGGLAGLAEDLAVQWLKGTLIYPDYQLLGTEHPAIALVMDYPQHAVTYALQDITVFPFAGALKGVKDSGWTQQPMLTAPERTWLETGTLDADIEYQQAQGDQLGPFMLGVALDRVAPDPEKDNKQEPLTPESLAKAEKEQAAREHQRVVVLADSDFLANGFIGTLGNQQLGLNILQWLSNRDAQISIDIPAAPDNKLFLAPWAPMLYGAAFILVLPLALVGVGVSRWWIRRRR